MTLHTLLVVGAFVTAIYAVVVGQLFIVRYRSGVEAERRAALEREWLPILVVESGPMDDALPSLRRRDITSFLILWNQLQEAFVGEITERLNDVGRRVGIDAIARRRLTSRSLRQQLLAVSTLGHLRDRDAWPTLARMTASPDGLLSLVAARALTRIDAAEALPIILPLAARRDDWSRNYVLGMLVELGADVVSGPLTQAALRMHPDQAHRLIRYFSVAHPADAIPVVRATIAKTTNVDCLSACLRVFADVDALDLVREYLHHPSWPVRVQAVNVLGRLGSLSDFARLQPLLSDREWWVRYRAAKAICALPGMEMEAIRLLGQRHSDPFARDMLAHVLAEAHP
jgi:hypothetical protein